MSPPHRERPWNFTALGDSYDPCTDGLAGVTCSATGRVTHIAIADVVRQRCIVMCQTPLMCVCVSLCLCVSVNQSPPLTGVIPDTLLTLSALAEFEFGAGLQWPTLVDFPEAPAAFTQALVASVAMKLPSFNQLFEQLRYSVTVDDGSSTVVVPATTAQLAVGSVGSRVDAVVDLSAYAGSAGAVATVRVAVVACSCVSVPPHTRGEGTFAFRSTWNWRRGALQHLSPSWPVFPTFATHGPSTGWRQSPRLSATLPPSPMLPALSSSSAATSPSAHMTTQRRMGCRGRAWLIPPAAWEA